MGYEFFGEKYIFPSAPVPDINNDQSLSSVFSIYLRTNEISKRVPFLWPAFVQLQFLSHA